MVFLLDVLENLGFIVSHKKVGLWWTQQSSNSGLQAQEDPVRGQRPGGPSQFLGKLTAAIPLAYRGLQRALNANLETTPPSRSRRRFGKN